MITRRGFLKAFGGTLLGGISLAGYAFGWEPMRTPRVTRYALTPPNWPQGLNLKIAAIADVHSCEPYMSADRIHAICQQTNALQADMIVLLGDYIAGHPYQIRHVPAEAWAAALATLRAPLGVHAILGNHDWWEDRDAQRRRKGPIFSRRALEQAGIPVYENDVVRLTKNGRPFWLAGLGDQIAFVNRNRPRGQRYTGVDDLAGTLAKVTDDAPVVLLAHEPDLFPRVPARVAVTLSGHTHGGQVRLFGYSPVVPSRYGNRFAYGHVVEDDRHLIVSGGLGCSIMPVRFGAPPEIVLVELGGSA
jgi:uncharacterized protein